jgi:hypothetical protein
VKTIKKPVSSPHGRLDLTVWLVLLLGLVTTALGVAYGVATMPAATPGASLPQSIVSAIVGSLGAGVVGAALSIVITRSADRDRREDLVAHLSQTLGARFSSDEADIQALHADWHHYHVTAIDGRYVWRYLFIRFSRSPAVGSLQTWLEADDGKGHVLEYLVEAGIRGSHAILLLTSTTGGVGDESTAVLPHLLTRSYRSHHCGVGLYQTWDGTDTIGRVIISRRPLMPTGPNATVADEHSGQLDELWEQGFPARGAIMPTGLTSVLPATVPPPSSRSAP